MKAIRDCDELQLQIVATGTMVLERFDQPVKIVRNDGFNIDVEVHIELEGSTPATMAKSVGFGVIEFATEYFRLKPDVVLVIGDRYEALAAVIAAAYMNICIVHIQGGEVSGSIDESARHAITKFAHYHVPSTRRAAEYLIRMGERPETVLTTGCPSSDIARALVPSLKPEVLNSHGSGAIIDLTRPFLLVVFHPITTEFGGETRQMEELLDALERVAIQTLLLWPNIDAGADHISKAIRRFRLNHHPDWLRTITNLSPEEYLQVLASTACAAGNSSSFVRDAGYFGTPVVLIGNRQDGREADEHVTRVVPEAGVIEAAIRAQLDRGRYEPSDLYGDGFVSERIRDGLCQLQPYIQKRLSYATEWRRSTAAAD
jgi:UDP-hydrolysing UDP-N-acetyl-D-glucosamine 2-epimerase